MKKYIISFVITSALIIPFTAFSATTITDGNINSSLVSSNGSSGGCDTPKDLGGLFTYTLCLLTHYVTPFLFGLGAVIFIVGVLTYVRAGDDVEKRAGGRDLMWFGIIALFVMISVWGFVNILSRSIFGKDSELPNLPREARSVFQQ